MTTIHSAVKEFILSCQADGLSKSTITWYTSLLGAFERAYPGQTLADISTHELRLYLLKLREGDYSEDTISAHTRSLHKFWGWCADEYPVANPMRKIKYPKKPQAKPKAANLDDIQLMFNVAGEGDIGKRNRAILAFMLDSGVRAAGLCGLRLADVDFVTNSAMVTEKGNKRRAVAFTQYTVDLLKEWLAVRQPVPHVFYDLDTLEPLKPNGLYQLCKRLARRGGVEGKFNPHSFRHTFSLEYMKSGGDLATLSKLLGHRDMSTTVGHYLAFTDGDIRQKHEKHSPVRKLKKPPKGP